MQSNLNETEIKNDTEDQKSESKNIDSDIEKLIKDFNTYLKKYEKRKYGSTKYDAEKRLTPVMMLIKETHENKDVPKLKSISTSLCSYILEFDKLVYNDNSTVSEYEAEILSEALYMMRNIKSCISERICELK